MPRFSSEKPSQPVLLRLTLPLPPSINEQYATVNGHRVSTTVARHFKQEVRAILRRLERQGELHAELRTRLSTSYLALFLDFTSLHRSNEISMGASRLRRMLSVKGWVLMIIRLSTSIW